MDPMVRMGAPIRLPPPWRELAEACGGVDVLATTLGVSVSTVHRWSRREVVPTRLVRDGVNRLAVSKGCRGPF